MLTVAYVICERGGLYHAANDIRYGFGEARMDGRRKVNAVYGAFFDNAACLTSLAEESARRAAFFYRKSHLKLLAAARDKADTTVGERAVIDCLLENTCVSAEGRLPLCQDIGTACLYAWKDEGVMTVKDDSFVIFRYPSASRVFEEVITGD